MSDPDRTSRSDGRPRFEYDGAVWTDGGPMNELESAVYRVYRTLAAERARAQKELAALRNEAQETARGFERRLARIASERCLLREVIDEVAAHLIDSGRPELHQRLRLVDQRLTSVLESAGVEVDCLKDAEMTPELEPLVEVEEMIPAPVPRTRIERTLQPLVRIEGRVVQPARVLLLVPDGSVAGGESSPADRVENSAGADPDSEAKA